MYNKFQLLNKIKQKKINIGIVGLGYVGLPLAIRFLKKKINVYGIDTDKKKISYLKKGKTYIRSIKTKDIKYFKKYKNRISYNYQLIEKIDVIIICLPTPLKNNYKPNLDYINDCVRKIAPFLKNKILILESTVYPGASEDIIKKFIINKYDIGKEVFIGYSPERENPGDKNFSYQKTPKVVSGYTDNCLILVSKIYKIIAKKVYKAKNIETAEMSKLLENIYRSVNISLINELKIISKLFTKINIFDVIETAGTKNFGFSKFYPGPGIGGHCIPVDPHYLSWAARKRGFDSKFIKLSGQYADFLPKWILKKILQFFKSQKLELNKVLILGISYKANVDDDRESPSYKLIKLLNKKKIRYHYHDPYFPSLRIGRINKSRQNSLKLNKRNLKKFDATIIFTDHEKINYKIVNKYSKFIFDTRGVMRKKNFINNKIIEL
jgi:UDP-N-acetyl-D-glucosamine dehydrogenase